MKHQIPPAIQQPLGPFSSGAGSGRLFWSCHCCHHPTHNQGQNILDPEARRRARTQPPPRAYLYRRGRRAATARCAWACKCVLVSTPRREHSPCESGRNRRIMRQTHRRRSRLPQAPTVRPPVQTCVGRSIQPSPRQHSPKMQTAVRDGCFSAMQQGQKAFR